MYRFRAYPVTLLVAIVFILIASGHNASAQQKPATNTAAVAAADSLAARMLRQVELNVGYTQLKPENLTEAVGSLSGGKLDELARASATGLLQGQLSGVKSVSTSGTPGSGALLTIRGISTFNGGADPLFVVDGIPVKSSRVSKTVAGNIDNDPLADITPSDIASITVLKDGQATARYGMRGANGVVLITTNGGTNGRTLLNFSGFTGMANAAPVQDVLDADAYRAYIIEKEQARGLSPLQINSGVGRYLLLSTPAANVERYNNNTEWQKILVGNGVHNDYHLALRGGDAVSKYSVSAGYASIGGTVAPTSYSRFTTRFNVDYKIGRKLSFLNSVSYVRSSRDLNDEGNALRNNPMYVAALKSPVLTAFRQNTDGVDQRDLDSADYAGQNNPYAMVSRMRNDNNTNRIMGKVVAQYVFNPHWTLKVGLNLDIYRLEEKRFLPAEGFLKQGYIIRAASQKVSLEQMMLNENILNYNRTSKSGNTFSAFIGQATQFTSQNIKFGMAINSPSDEFGNVNATDARLIDSVSGVEPRWNLVSFFGGADYAIKNKYLFGATLRADGSSRFAPGKRFGYFPSVSAGWRIGQEDFLKNSKLISELKLRGSFGISGNQEVGLYNAINALVPAGYFDYSGVKIGLLGNPNFTWEETKQFDAGIDLGLAKDRVALTADFYSRKTDNLYNIIPLPGLSGFRSYAVSEGAVRNSGLELGISGKILTGKWGWQTSLNASYNKNTILSTPALFNPVTENTGFATVFQKGNSIGAFYGYKALGVYKSTADVKLKNGADNLNPFQGGDMIFEDVDNNGIIDQADRQVIGNSNPDWFGGFSNTFSYNHFELDVFVDFSLGSEIYNGQRASLEAMSNYDNQSTAISGRWMKDGDDVSMPRLLHGDVVGNTRFSSRWIEDGSYARIKSLSLAYNFPLNGSLKKVFKSARVLVSGQNLHTFTKYSGNTPDLASVSNPIGYAQDYAGIPQMRTFLLGIKLGL